MDDLSAFVDYVPTQEAMDAAAAKRKPVKRMLLVDPEELDAVKARIAVLEAELQTTKQALAEAEDLADDRPNLLRRIDQLERASQEQCLTSTRFSKSERMTTASFSGIQISGVASAIGRRLPRYRKVRNGQMRPRSLRLLTLGVWRVDL